VRFLKQANEMNCGHPSAIAAEAKASSIGEAKAIIEAKASSVIISKKKSF